MSLKTTVLSAGLDDGETDCEIDDPDSRGEIYALGFILWDANCSISLTYGHPLKPIASDIGKKDI